MLFALQLLAQAQEGGQAPQAAPGSGLLTLLPLVVVFILFYFFLIRAPMKRQEQERHTLLSSLKKNDRVVTSGGLIGSVVEIKEKDDEIILKVDDNSNVRVRVTKGSVVRNLSGEKAARESKDGAA